jgi:transcriptional regulator of aromatic amino acid metabolism
MHSRGNILVCGVATAVDAFIARFANHAPQPIRYLTTQSFVVPSYTDGTLILQGVDALDRAQQAALLRWLENPQIQTRVVATSTTPVYNQVQAGTFLGPLFYRLNVVHITVVPE